MDNPRLQALRVLMSVDKNKAYANLALPKDSEQGLSGVDKALLIQLVYGTLSHQITLDYVLNQHLKQPLDTMPIPVRNILRLGAFQLLFLDRVPPRAAVDESVKLAHKFGHRGTIGLVNAVLRKVAVSTDISWPDEATDLIHYLSVRYAHPLFLVERYL
ncbi:MAG: transcription antitermination factor NusB, partial [Bacillota bacterium]|nr:transcription antitermination factor NusB [Bacillota bacterium]